MQGSKAQWPDSNEGSLICLSLFGDVQIRILLCMTAVVCNAWPEQSNSSCVEFSNGCWTTPGGQMRTSHSSDICWKQSCRLGHRCCYSTQLVCEINHIIYLTQEIAFWRTSWVARDSAPILAQQCMTLLLNSFALPPRYFGAFSSKEKHREAAWILKSDGSSTFSLPNVWVLRISFLPTAPNC